jgi:hypothetical protein
MNDRAAVKSPENPGFKPKTRPVRTCGVGELSRSSAPSTRSGGKLLRFDQKHRKLTKRDANCETLI